MRRRRVRRARPMAIPRSPWFPWRPWLSDLPEIDADALATACPPASHHYRAAGPVAEDL